MKDFVERTLVSADAVHWLEFVAKHKQMPPPGYKFAFKYGDQFKDGNYYTTLIFERM